MVLILIKKDKNCFLFYWELIWKQDLWYYTSYIETKLEQNFISKILAVVCFRLISREGWRTEC